MKQIPTCGHRPAARPLPPGDGPAASLGSWRFPKGNDWRFEGDKFLIEYLWEMSPLNLTDGRRRMPIPSYRTGHSPFILPVRDGGQRPVVQAPGRLLRRRRLVALQNLAGHPRRSPASGRNTGSDRLSGPRGHFASGAEQPPSDRHRKRHRPRHPCGVVRRQWCQRLGRDHPSRSEGRRFPGGMFAPAPFLPCGGGREGAQMAFAAPGDGPGWGRPEAAYPPAHHGRPRHLSSRPAEPLGKPSIKGGVHGRPPVHVICLRAQATLRYAAFRP